MAPFYHIAMLYFIIQQQWLYALTALYAAYFSTYKGMTLLMAGRNIKKFLFTLCICLLGVTRGYSGFLHATPSSENVIIAKIKTQLGTIEITQAQFLSYWKNDPQAQAEDILHNMIEFELLAQQAYAQKLDQSLSTQVSSKSIMVKHYLQQNFEPQWSLNTLPQHYVDLATRQNIHFFRHPELRNGAHILLMPDRTIKERPQLTLEDKAVLSDLIHKVQQDLQSDPPKSQSEFQKRVERYHPWMPLGYRAHFEFLQKFARQGTYVESFSKACFQITQAQQMTGVIETEYGYHIAWIEEVIAAKDQSDEDIEQHVRRKIVPEVRQLELQKLIHHLAKEYPIKRYLNQLPTEMESDRG